MELERRKEIINICLDLFVDKGLFETSTRSLSSALKLQNAGLYYYFTTKDEVVIQCAEEAVLRLENVLIYPAIKDIIAPNLMIKRLLSRADEMAPTMSFFVSVCASGRYKKDIQPLLDRLSDRCKKYIGKISDVLGCERKEIAPYVYMTITAVANYMLFPEKSLIQSQLEIVKDKIIDLQRRNYRMTYLVKYGKITKGYSNECKVAWQI